MRAYSNSTTPNPIPATFLRGGTSKGIFINRAHLPANQSDWDRIFLGIMGSPDSEYGRQLNGMGGGVSSLSKICVVGEPSSDQKSQGIQAEYTFVQVGIRDTSIDVSGNCGNLSSMIGVFALDEKICHQPTPNGDRITIRSFNTNTRKIIDTTFPVITTDDGGVTADLNVPEASIAGVPGQASQITLEFANPAGARTGKLFPTGSPLDVVTVPDPAGTPTNVNVSLVDATNPTVFTSHSELSTFLPVDDFLAGKQPALANVGEVLEAIRQRGAEGMGLDPSAQAQPKIVLLSSPKETDLAEGVDIVIHALSMEVLHKAVPMTVGLCLGVASNVQGTLAWEIIQRSRARRETDPGFIRIMHPSGTVDVGAEFSSDGVVKSAMVMRTGRRLMKGVVWW
ncbi:hypothetical protein AMATHDRAFT_6778 [Amanita thiersii Skay4041]|uniref:DUF453-domain-containing protein n=1 Tax=Amanita thiersii Skay4041 TaxID=703135 RepID=A0A2A9NDM3_9AGAR|nr:hypothetical protein AMATHDRAFT_6778 [Amanita thiersii Skay4041]